MALDPLSQKIVDVLSAGFPRLGETVFDAAQARASLAALPATAGIPRTQVARVEDRTIPGAAGPIPVRLYWPGGDTRNLPVVVFLHGGGFVLGNLDGHDAMARDLCAGAGAITVSVDYRLAPEHPCPAAADDAYSSLLWAHENAVSLGGDPARIGVAGDSAGGNLAAVTCLRSRDEKGPAISHQLLIYPVLDSAQNTVSYTAHAEGGFLTARAMAWFWEQYLGPEADGDHPYVSPLRAPDLSGLPPACVITAEHDPLRDEGEAYAIRLAEFGVGAEVHRFDGAFHGFLSVSHVLGYAREALSLAASAQRKALGTD